MYVPKALTRDPEVVIDPLSTKLLIYVMGGTLMASRGGEHGLAGHLVPLNTTYFSHEYLYIEDSVPVP